MRSFHIGLSRFDMVITIATLLFLAMGGWSLGYEMGKNIPCSQVENIQIKPIP